MSPKLQWMTLLTHILILATAIIGALTAFFALWPHHNGSDEKLASNQWVTNLQLGVIRESTPSSDSQKTNGSSSAAQKQARKSDSDDHLLRRIIRRSRSPRTTSPQYYTYSDGAGPKASGDNRSSDYIDTTRNDRRNGASATPADNGPESGMQSSGRQVAPDGYITNNGGYITDNQESTVPKQDSPASPGHDTYDDARQTGARELSRGAGPQGYNTIDDTTAPSAGAPAPRSQHNPSHNAANDAYQTAPNGYYTTGDYGTVSYYPMNIYDYSAPSTKALQSPRNSDGRIRDYSYSKSSSKTRGEDPVPVVNQGYNLIDDP